MTNPDDFDQLPGLPPWVVPLLRACAIRGIDELAAYRPETLAKLLRERIFLELTPTRIEAEDWIGLARQLTAPDVGADHAKPAEVVPQDPNSRADARSQLAGFTVFFDALADAADEGPWQVRIYHDESGEEVAFPSIDPGPWATWILSRALDESERSLHYLVVTVKESKVIASAGDATRTVEVTLRVDGLKELERAVGRGTISAAFTE